MIDALACIISILAVGFAVYVFGSLFFAILKAIVENARVRRTQNIQERGSAESWGLGWSDGSYSWDGGYDGGCDWGGGCDGGDCGGGGDGGCGGDG